MDFPQVIAVFHAIFNVIGFPGNLLVIVTIALERRLHVMRYILLASLAVSDVLCLILTNSFRIATIAQERWVYGQTMCDLNALSMRYFYLNTVLHLIAVSYERYKVIVKSPLTYDGSITKSRLVFMALIWVVPIPFCLLPFLVWDGKFVIYNPEVFFCLTDNGFSAKSDFKARAALFFTIVTFALFVLIIAFLNWSVFKTANNLQGKVAQVGSIDGHESSQQQEISRRARERKAAVDVSIIIAAFLLCFLPVWITALFRQFVKSTKVPAEVILSTNCIFLVSSLCNPIIYSIRKRDFRAGVKNVLRRMGICGSPNEINVTVKTRE